MLIIIIIAAVSAFVGFAIGRLGDKYGGHLVGPHHWIYGVILIAVGAYYLNHLTGIAALSFGTGHFISDLNDFLHFRIGGVDIPHKWRFWNID